MMLMIRAQNVPLVVETLVRDDASLAGLGGTFGLRGMLVRAPS